MKKILSGLVLSGALVVGGQLFAVPVAAAQPYSQTSFNSCMAKPPKIGADGLVESAYAQRERCCTAAGGVISNSGAAGLPQCKAPQTATVQG